MKSRKQKCSDCNGIGLMNMYDTLSPPCSVCEGAGVEIIISPRQWKEYQWLEKIADELEAKQIEVADLKKKD